MSTLAAAPETLTVDQAIFTSIRSPMGSGYRLVAASTGLSPEERRELVQVCPSHGNLCDSGPEATGFASFPLRSGRQCLLFAEHAGPEHSARGGQRVHTHVLVLETKAFRAFGCDPFAVLAGLAGRVEPGWVQSPPRHLEALSVTAKPAALADAGAGPSNDQAEIVIAILRAVLDEPRVLVTGATDHRRLMHWIIQSLPVAVRGGLTFAAGLKASPARKFRLLVASDDRTEAARFLQDGGVRHIAWSQPPELAPSPFDAWLNFVARHWDAGHLGQLQALCAKLTRDASAATLTRVVALYNDLERVALVNPETLDRLMQNHARMTPQNELEHELLERFRNAAQQREPQATGVAAEPQ